MENVKSGPTMRKRKNLLDSRMDDDYYEDLHHMDMADCRLRGIAEVSINDYEFAYMKFKMNKGYH